MLQFVCHPALQNLLTSSKEGIKCVTSSENAVLISDYLPKTSQSIHAGLLEAVKFRLFNPSQTIYYASFFPEEKLIPLDTFGILSLPGTEFIQLPFHKENFFKTLEDTQKAGLILLESDCEKFAIKACKVLLKNNLRVIIHYLGGKIGAIQINIQASNNEKLKKILEDVRSFCEKEEIDETFKLSEVRVSQKLPDNEDYVKTFAEFRFYLNTLKSFANKNNINFDDLLSNTENLHYTLIKLGKYA
jgi:hypothetical protein